MSEVTFQPGKRRLCPDGACIGVIGEDGRCRVCGISVSTNGAGPTIANAPVGDRRDDSGTDGGAPEYDAAAAVSDAAEPGDETVADETRDDGVDVGRSAPGAGGAGFRPDRRLCDDGSCIGVVGGDGVCSVCGRRPEEEH